MSSTSTFPLDTAEKFKNLVRTAIITGATTGATTAAMGQQHTGPGAPAPAPISVERAATAVVEAVSNRNDVAVVAVKSDWSSKIIWAQVVGFLAMVLALFGVDIDAQTQAQLIAGITAVVTVGTFVFKKWFTSTISTSSANLAAPSGTVV